jgi:ribulose 1,5-bisphosphate carboxylase large subunit-like protein
MEPVPIHMARPCSPRDTATVPDAIRQRPPEVDSRYHGLLDTPQVSEACHAEISVMPPIWPSRGGGIRRDRVEEMVEFYGRDVVLLIGGDVHRGPSLRRSAKAIRAAVR